LVVATYWNNAFLTFKTLLAASLKRQDNVINISYLGPMFKNLFISVIYYARLFAPSKPFQPNLVFMDKASNLLLECMPYRTYPQTIRLG
jgi:hypothetical protein